MKNNYIKLISGRGIFFNLLLLLTLHYRANAQNAGTYTYSTATGQALSPFPTTNFSLLSTSGQDDASSSVIPIGFTLEFDGSYYSSFSANTNGLVTLGSTAVSTTGTNNLTSSAINPKLAPYWDDLTTGTNGYVATWLTGTAPNRIRVVEWKVTVPKNIGLSANAVFQLWIHETSNRIRFIYGANIVTNTAAYSIGISGSSGTFHSITASSHTSSTATANNSNTGGISTGRTYLLTPPSLLPGCVLNAAPANGSAGLSTLTQLSWQPNFGSPTGYNVYFGTSANPPLVASAQTATTYVPTLSPNTTYYWKVEPINSVGTNATCPVNSFQTNYLLNYRPTRSENVTFNSIASTGTSVSGWRNSNSTDDNLSQAVPIGFNFTYQQASYSSLLISTNGFVTLNTATTAIGNGPGSYGYFNSNLTNGTSSNNSPLIIAPLYEDLVCQGNPGSLAGLNSSIRYAVSGAAPNRVFTVEWIGMETFNNAGPNLNFQVKLYETSGNIEFCYGTMEGFNGTSSYNYTSSIGINAVYLTDPTLSGQFFVQQVSNTESFGNTPSNSINILPRCNSSLLLSPGSYTPTTVTVSAPTNDQAVNAIEVFVSPAQCTELCGTYHTSQAATASGQAVCSGSADDDVWFRFTATNAQTSFRVTGGSDYDAVFEVWNAALNTRLFCRDTSSAGATEQLAVTNLVNGTSYYVRVFHKGVGSGITGQFSLCIFATPLPPVNDNCSNAILLSVGASCSSTAGTSTLAATASAGIPVCTVTGTTPDDDVWYSFVSPNPVCSVTVQGAAGFNPVVQLFSGSCTNLQAIQCANTSGSGQSETIIASGLTLGATYYVRVYHAATGAGTGQFSICVFSPVPGCASGFTPANATQDISQMGTTLRWNKSANTNGYRIFLDTNNPPVTLLANLTDTFVTTGPLLRGASYFWTVVPYNASGSAGSCGSFVFATEPLGVTMQLKTFLQGYYQTNGLMKSALGSTMDTIADTLTLSVANSTAPYQIVGTGKFLLGTNGIATFEIPQPCFGSGSFYLVLNHRNHLETWSAVPLEFTAVDSLYDMSNAQSKFFGGNVVEVAPGTWAIYAGDVNKDKSINSADVTSLENAARQFQLGYVTGDLTGDGLVESADYSLLENNGQLFLFTLRP